MDRTRVILLDDHRVLLDALKNLIEPEFHVVGIFDDPQKLLDGAAALRPEIIILDIGMPVMNGLSVAEHLKKVLPKARLIFLTAFEDLETASQAFQAGAFGYVLKASAGADLLKAMREVARGGYYASPVLTEGMLGSFVRAFKQMKSPHNLTPRQTEVLKLLAEGFSMKQVARALDITPRTVAFHKYTMMEQLNIRTSAELINFANSHLH